MYGDTLVFAQVMFIIVASTVSFVAIGLGARHFWMRGTSRTTAAGSALDEERMRRLETAVDTIAIEVERISEAQRFMVGLLSEALPARRAELAAPAQGRANTPH